MPPTIHIVCEAESHNGAQVRDPSITENGILQARELLEDFPHMDQVRAIFSSPLRRAIQTTLVAFEPVLTRGVQITLRQNLQGLRGNPNNTGSPWQELREEFGYGLDVQDLPDGWWYEVTNDVHNFNADLATEQARQARLQIRDAARELGDDDHIVVITHRLFIEYLVGNNDENFLDGHYGSYQFTDLFNANDNTATLARVDEPDQPSDPSDPSDPSEPNEPSESSGSNGPNGPNPVFGRRRFICILRTH
ncbi:hypothetical protein F4859DRAFT_526937 [Xylaria cf. heliscus]|nr:hypothetical protein F4859DRAFT_526937 [Xylaria cf. heliscus]